VKNEEITCKTALRRVWKAIESHQTTINKWKDRENKQGKNCYTNIPLVRNRILKFR
jgi:hypothetical protein